MHETNATDDTHDLTGTYLIGGQRYRLEPLSWQQQQWLGESVFKDADVAAVDYGAIHDIGRAQGPLFMAICLIRDGQTRKEKSLLPWREILALAEEFRGELTGMEVASFCTHFFFFCRPNQLAMLMPGRIMQNLFLEEARRAEAPHGQVSSGDDGSSTVSPLSRTVTLPDSTSFDQNSAPLSPGRISEDDLSRSPRSTPSLVSAGSGSPG